MSVCFQFSHHYYSNYNLVMNIRLTAQNLGLFRYSFGKVAERSSSGLIILSSFPKISLPNSDQKTLYHKSVPLSIFYTRGSWLKRLRHKLIFLTTCSNPFIEFQQSGSPFGSALRARKKIILLAVNSYWFRFSTSRMVFWKDITTNLQIRINLHFSTI